MELPPSSNLSVPVVKGPWILVQPPAENGPASGRLWFLERSWMSWQAAAAFSGQASPGVGSIPPPAPGLPPANVLPGKRCRSSAMRSYPCLLNGLKTSENIEIIFYFNDQKGVAHYSQPTHKMSWFSIFLRWSFNPFDSWPSSGHGFSEKKNKKSSAKPHPISAYQKSNIILNETARSSHAKAVSRAASDRSSQLLGSSRRRLGSGEHQLDVWGAGRCPASSCSTKNGILWTSFCTVREISHHWYWNQRMAASPTRVLSCHQWIWVLARDCSSTQEEFQLTVGQKKMTLFQTETVVAGPSAWHRSVYSQRLERYWNYLNKPKEPIGSQKQMLLLPESGLA